MATKEGRELVKEAVKDAQALKDAAFEAAKNEIVNQMAPGVKALLEKQIRSALGEKRGLTGRAGQSQRGDYFTPDQQRYEEGKDKGEKDMADEKDDKEKELDLESLAGFFPQLSEDPDADPDADPGLANVDPSMHLQGMHGEDEDPEAPPSHPHREEEDADPAYEGMSGMSIPKLGEDADPDADPEMKEGKDKEKEEMDEEVEISESELKKVYESALQMEAQVSKGFKEMTAAGELDDVHKDISKGIEKLKSGEHAWEKEVPPDHVDYQIKEMVARGMAENKMLRKKFAEAVVIIRKMAKTLHETNLFNSKVLHVNRILNSHPKLTKEQRQVVLETIDSAKSVDSVKMVYETIVRSFKATSAASQLSESKARKPAANAQRPRTTGTPKPEVLRESVDRAQGQGQYDRMRQLAGLLK